MNRKKIFVSGGAGVIGTALVNTLIQMDADVFVGDLKPEPAAWKNVLHYRQGDLITLTSQEIAAFEPEVYFHLAATFERSTETYDFLEDNFHHNIALSHHLLKLLKDMKSLKKIIFASSYLIYDPALYLNKDAAPLKEDAPISPRNICGMAKLLHERELLFLKLFRPEIQVVNARIFRSYGKNSRDIISRWIQALLKKENISVYCPEGKFDFVYAEDVAKALINLSKTDFNGVVNVGSGRERSINEVLDVLKTHFGNISFNHENTNIPRENSQADTTLFHSLVNQTFLPIEETIPEMIAASKKG